ncbi:3-phosphoshikimate 1-carboxyvinyltransferase [Methanofollis formosanus]|uniref:3-phosphoshikimate 1-carboxyvinyltransferase n=1 Tax=Methanofollis formosanus TaxID=299308 RepID=A0A8G1A171_9EURY|nr:3-phosphoshikimate 1-carboxyvinyltransferase [Methanofollis formosanus]QYZ79534.1 3-phosphoshikimate 1-carboxyvinyltransferase [Methanofollis formosanus]
MEVTLARHTGVDLAVAAPPSKSLTHRALVVAALADGESEIVRPLEAGDIARTRTGLTALGIRVAGDADVLTVQGCGGRLPLDAPVVIDAGDSGTSLRFLTGLATLGRHPVTLTGSARMQQRPIGPLGDAVAALGGEVRYAGRPGFPPLTVRGPVRGGSVALPGDVSSQFVSALLIAAPCWPDGLALTLETPPVSASYLALTTGVMAAFGVEVRREEETFLVEPGRYRPTRYEVEGDWSSASTFFAIGAVCGGRVRVDHLDPASAQGDRRFLDALAAMGCRVRADATGVVLESDGVLDGAEIEMATSPDTVQNLAAVAAFARGPTTITGTAHLRYKESDRVAAIARVLRGFGAGVEVGEDRITVSSGPRRGHLTVDPVHDHRTAMSAAVLGLGSGDVTVQEAECVAKSFPGFWEALQEGGLV